MQANYFCILTSCWKENSKLHAYFAEYLMHSNVRGQTRFLRNTIHEF